jgi:hypothetical protein
LSIDSPFDWYAPTTRSFDTGSYPIKTFQSQNGAEIRILYGNKPTGKKMTLTYANVEDRVAMEFIDHYHSMFGSYTQFELGDIDENGVRAGWIGDRKALGASSYGLAWRYAKQPEIESGYRGFSTVRIELIATQVSRVS